MNEITDQIAAYSEKKAEKTLRAILAKVKLLADFPTMGQRQVFEQNPDKEYRDLVEQHYKVYYSVENSASRIIILTVFDTRQKSG